MTVSILRRVRAALIAALALAAAVAGPASDAGWLQAAAQTWATQGAVSISASGDNTVIAGVAGQAIQIYGLDLACASPVTLQLKNGATALTGVMTVNGYAKPLSPARPWWTVAPGAALVITLGAAVQCSGSIWYQQS